MRGTGGLKQDIPARGHQWHHHDGVGPSRRIGVAFKCRCEWHGRAPQDQAITGRGSSAAVPTPSYARPMQPGR